MEKPEQNNLIVSKSSTSTERMKHAMPKRSPQVGIQVMGNVSQTGDSKVHTDQRCANAPKSSRSLLV